MITVPRGFLKRPSTQTPGHLGPIYISWAFWTWARPQGFQFPGEACLAFACPVICHQGRTTCFSLAVPGVAARRGRPQLPPKFSPFTFDRDVLFPRRLSDRERGAQVCGSYSIKSTRGSCQVHVPCQVPHHSRSSRVGPLGEFSQLGRDGDFQPIGV